MNRLHPVRVCLLAAMAAAFAASTPARAQNPGVIVDWGGQSFEGWSGIPANSPDGRALAPRFDATRPAPPAAAERGAGAPAAARATRAGNSTAAPVARATPAAGQRPASAPAQAARPEPRWEIPEYQLLQAAPAAVPTDPAPAGPRHDPPDHELPGVWPERAAKADNDRAAQ